MFGPFEMSLFKTGRNYGSNSGMGSGGSLTNLWQVEKGRDFVGKQFSKQGGGKTWIRIW